MHFYWKIALESLGGSQDRKGAVLPSFQSIVNRNRLGGMFLGKGWNKGGAVSIFVPAGNLEML